MPANATPSLPGTPWYASPSAARATGRLGPVGQRGLEADEPDVAVLVEVRQLGPGAEEVGEGPEAEGLLAEGRVHPLHLLLDGGGVEPVSVVLLVTEPERPLEQAARGRLGALGRLVLRWRGRAPAAAPLRRLRLARLARLRRIRRLGLGVLRRRLGFGFRGD